jgi:hypothetical protein
MTLTELLESVRRVEVRTNRLVNDTMVGAYLSGFKGRGVDCAHFISLEFERFGNCGEFVIIKRQTGEMKLILIPSNSTGLKTRAALIPPNLTYEQSKDNHD